MTATRGNRAGRWKKKQPMALAPSGGQKKKRTGVFFKPAMYLWLLLVMGVSWTGWQVPRLFTEAERFELKALEVRGLRVLTGSEVLRASGLQVKDNLFAVDLRLVQERVERLAWVKNALVWRRPPDRLAVDIVERRRVVWIDLGEVYGLDSEGVLLPAKGMMRESYREWDLPVISGLEVAADSLYPGMSVADSTLDVLLEWWRQASNADAEFCMNVSEIQPLGPGNIRLRLVGDGLEVRLPADRAPERLQVLKRFMEQIYREHPNPAYVDMRFAGQLVVGGKESGR